MANRLFWQYLIDQNGAPIEEASINVYLAGTSTLANIRYPNATSSFTTSDATAINTDSNGKFYFYVSDLEESDTYGYEYTQEFKITYSKAGVESGIIDDIQIFGIHYEVNVESSNTKAIRSVSNANAKKWEDHADTTYSGGPHDIGQVDETSTGTTKDKLVSDRLIYDMYRHWNNLSPRDDDHCFSEDTELLTEDGFVLYEDIHEGQQALTLNLDTNKLEYNVIKGKYVYDDFNELVSFKNKYGEILVTKKHVMIFSPDPDRPKRNYISKYKKCNAEELLNNTEHCCIPVAAESDGEHFEENLDFFKLLGFIISDGHFFDPKKEEYAVSIHQKLGNEGYIEDVLKKLNVPYVKKIRKINNDVIMVQFYIRSNWSRNNIRNWISGKRISDKLMKLRGDQFRAFLAGLIFGDGSVRSSKLKLSKEECCERLITNYDNKISYSYFTGDAALKDQLSHLCILNGLKVYSFYRKIGYGKGHWVLNFSNRQKVLFYKKGKSTINYSGKVWCVSVDNQTLVLRRNGFVFIAGNTQYVRVDGTRELSSDWDIGEDITIQLEYLQARDSEGITFLDDGDNLGFQLLDGGEVYIPNVNIDSGFADDLVLGRTTPTSAYFTDIIITGDTTFTGTTDFTNIECETLLVTTSGIISGGRLENVVIGGVVPTAATFTYLDSDWGNLDGGNLDDVRLTNSRINSTVIGTSIPSSGYFTEIDADYIYAGYIYGDEIHTESVNISGGFIDNTIIGMTAPASATFTEIDATTISSYDLEGITFKHGAFKLLKLDYAGNMLFHETNETAGAYGVFSIGTVTIAPTGSINEGFLMYSNIVSAGGGYDCPHFHMGDDQTIKLYQEDFIEDSACTVPVSASGSKSYLVRSDVYNTLIDFEEKINYVLTVLRNFGLMKT